MYQENKIGVMVVVPKESHDLNECPQLEPLGVGASSNSSSSKRLSKTVLTVDSILDENKATKNILQVDLIQNG